MGSSMLKAFGDQLTKGEAVALIDFSYRTIACKKEAHFKQLVLDLKQFLPFENVVCVNGSVVDFLGEKEIDSFVDYLDISYPPGYLDFYFSQEFARSDAVLMEMMSTLSPVNWSAVDKRCAFDYPASVKAREFNMIDGWSHGTLDLETMDLTAFFLGGPVRDDSPRSAAILDYATPFLAGAYKRLLGKEKDPSQALTAREIEVLNWIKEGKGSWEISKILKCSRRTIDFHVANIKAKLGVVNRAQAVAAGLQNGTIHF